MAISIGITFDQKDVFIDYPLKAVMYRWYQLSKTIYVRFYGECESQKLVLHDNRLYNDALLYGNEIDLETYEAGAERR